MNPHARPVPVTILTGFLGAGKTTLLNHILTARHGHRIAVIENEFGEVDVDSDLVMTSDEEIFQIVNGCICCVVDVRTDLVKILQQLLDRPEPFDHILVETSGLADPTPVAATFFMDNEVARKVRLDGVVTLVDALHIEAHLDDPELEGFDNQAVDQIVVADRVLLNKIDLVAEQALQCVERRIRALNASAQILRSSHAQVDLSSILGIQGFVPGTVALGDTHFLDTHEHVCDAHCDHDPHHAAQHAAGHGHAHDLSVNSVSLVFDAPFDLERLHAWLTALTERDGQDLFRLKGIVAIVGDPQRHVVQGVHQLLEIRPAEPWGATPATSKLVFIGRHLSRTALQAGLLTCLAVEAEALAA